MRNNKIYYTKLLFLLFVFLLPKMQTEAADTLKISLNEILYQTELQYQNMLESVPDITKYPRSVNSNGSTRIVSSSDWTSGFFPGGLWYLFELTRKSTYRSLATNRNQAIADQRFNTSTHDLGFMLYCSFGNGLKLTGNENYKLILLDAATSLSSRYNATVGCIRSWDFGSWSFPVIIDNMMNLELLFWATKESGDSSYYKIAVNHAKTTLRNHFREDNSSWHLVDYNPVTGEIVNKMTVQGAFDNSSWARGQAWGLYGFTMTFRETGDSTFLHQAVNIADYIIANPSTPSDLIPYWDYMAPDIPNEPRDDAAAAITASALLELAQYTESNKEEYLAIAKKILQSLSSEEYFARPNTNNFFLLKHGTGNKPANSEVDVPLIYDDYYFLEALTRYHQLSEINNPPALIIDTNINVFANDTSEFKIIGYDIDNFDPLNFQISDNPDYVKLDQINDSVAILIVMPNPSHIGNRPDFRIKVSDSDGESTEKTIHLSIADPFWKNIVVTASDSQVPNLPENTLDNDFNTRWSADGNGEWVRFDLDTLIILKSVEIAFYNGNQRQSNFTVQVSTDGVSWKTVLYGTSSGSSLALESFTLTENPQARHIKITGFGNTQNSWNSYTEIRFTFESIATQSKINGVSGIALELFPNPASDIIYVTLQGIQNCKGILMIYDISGENVFSEEVKSTNGTNHISVAISTSGLKAGTYFLEFKSGEYRSIRTLIKT